MSSLCVSLVSSISIDSSAASSDASPSCSGEPARAIGGLASEGTLAATLKAESMPAAGAGVGVAVPRIGVDAAGARWTGGIGIVAVSTITVGSIFSTSTLLTFWGEVGGGEVDRGGGKIVRFLHSVSKRVWHFLNEY
jgi:hypothetical protein